VKVSASGTGAHESFCPVARAELGAQLPAARHSGADTLPPAQAARQPLGQWREVFCHFRPFADCQRPRLAGQDDNDHQPALASAKFPQEKPLRE